MDKIQVFFDTISPQCIPKQAEIDCAVRSSGGEKNI